MLQLFILLRLTNELVSAMRESKSSKVDNESTLKDVTVMDSISFNIEHND